ncbi:putative oxidoreductase [Cladophialophora carrionii]|uniref:Putative oxidoreductase n=1 Tax=Cladophialophora carrionii TaxID=86049 RepID=A0A1C1CEM0_9EURO|nr:putative oxidoreductase [Cladophialophora carrionii]
MGDSDFSIPSTFTSFTKTWHSESYATISPTRPELSASGKNVVVTGGGTGIGKHIAIAFAHAGAQSISILGRREDRLVTSSKAITDAAQESKNAVKVLYRVTDLTKKANVDESFTSLAGEVGPLHILISNAGVFPGAGPLATVSADSLMAGFETNVRGALYSIQAFLPLASSGPDGSAPMILNIGTGTHMAPIPGIGPYMVSKAANHKMIDYIATENPKVHVVNVCPGVIETEMSEPNKDSVSHWDSPDLPGHFCVWLASQEAKFLKSKTVWANWDADEMMSRKEEIQSSRLLTWLLDGVPM